MRALIAICVLNAALSSAALVPWDARAASPTLSDHFDEMLRSDFGPEAVFAYAEAAEQVGDLDAAIAALERGLRRNDLPQLRRFLARLYTEIGNAERAAFYGAEQERASATKIWGSASLGYGYETNPQSTSIAGAIRLFDVNRLAVVLVDPGDAADDRALTVSLDLNMAHNLSPGATLAAELAISAQDYTAIDDLDALTGSVTVGPYLVAGQVMGNPLVVRPYFNVAAGTLSAEPYFWSGVVGLNANLQITDYSGLTLFASGGYRDYASGLSTSFDANDLDAVDVRFGAGGYFGTRDGFSVSAYLAGGLQQAEVRRESTHSISFGARALAPLPKLYDHPLSLEVSADLVWDHYRGVDFFVDPNTLRRDLSVFASASLALGVADELDLSVGVDYLRQFSTLDLFATQSLRGFMEMTYGF